MNFSLVRLTRLSGSGASFYTIRLAGETETELDKFITENTMNYPGEVRDIVKTLTVIGRYQGAREQYFRLKEGKPGDLVCALHDDPEHLLRLYGIRYGATLVILGGGGPKQTQAWQDDPVLSAHAGRMIRVSDMIAKRMSDGDICFSPGYIGLEGNLEFKEENDE